MALGLAANTEATKPCPIGSQTGCCPNDFVAGTAPKLLTQEEEDAGIESLNLRLATMAEAIGGLCVVGETGTKTAPETETETKTETETEETEEAAISQAFFMCAHLSTVIMSPKMHCEDAAANLANAWVLDKSKWGNKTQLACGPDGQLTVASSGMCSDIRNHIKRLVGHFPDCVPKGNVSYLEDARSPADCTATAEALNGYVCRRGGNTYQAADHSKPTRESCTAPTPSPTPAPTPVPEVDPTACACAGADCKMLCCPKDTHFGSGFIHKPEVVTQAALDKAILESSYNKKIDPSQAQGKAPFSILVTDAGMLRATKDQRAATVGEKTTNPPQCVNRAHQALIDAGRGCEIVGYRGVVPLNCDTGVLPTKPATLSFEVDLGDIDLSTATATELAAAKKDAIAVAQKAGKFNSDDVSKVVFTQNGVEIDSTRRRRANGPITITIVFKADADVNMDAVLTSLNAAIAAGSVSLEVTIDGEVVTGAVTKAATGVAAEGAGAATVSAKMVTALAALTVGVAAAW